MKISFRPWVLGVTAFCLWAWSAPRVPAQGEVIAKVGASTITRSELFTHLMKFYGKAGLEQLIDRSVMRQEAARLKAEVTDADLNARVAELKKAAGSDFQQVLDGEGISEEAWRERVRYALLAEKVLEKKWPVTKDDLTRFSVRYARVKTRSEAQQIIRAARNGVSFPVLVGQHSADGKTEHRGLVQPNPFLRIDNPYFFKVTLELMGQGVLREGQISPQPIESEDWYLVLKLERIYAAETLKPKEREEAIARIMAYRSGALMPASRKRYKIEHAVALKTLIDDPKLPGDTVVSRVNSEAITRKQLVGHLLQYFGKTALDRLVERSLVAQEAARLNVTVSDAEVDERVAEAVKLVGQSAFQTALNQEGITEAAWRERARYSYLAEKVLNRRSPVSAADLERLKVRYIRVGTQETAQEVLRAAQTGARFEDLTAQRSLDRGGDGFIKPKAFLRMDNPVVFQAVGNTPAGRIVAQPVEAGGSWYVLKVEARLGPETLTAKERDAAVRRINAGRMGDLLTTLRKSYRVEQTVPLRNLIAEAAS
jgi:parvulin-like peptidyl-prolyl isomerase